MFLGFEEEGLLLEDTVHTAAVETPPPEELPAELPAQDLPEDITLPEPPVEVEASGSGTNDVDDLLHPTTPAAAAAAEEEEEVSLEETGSEVGLITKDVTINADATSETETEEVEVNEPAEEPTTLEEEHLDEVVVNEAEIPEELEISLITTETTEEEGLPALVPPPEAIDVVSEASETEVEEIDMLPLDEDVPPPDKEVNPIQPAEEADVNAALPYPEEPASEEGGVEESTESTGQEVKEETAPEAPAVEEEAPAVPAISKEDLSEDEILLVNIEEPEPPVTVFLSPAQPTALSPERESPFTLISVVNTATEGQPDIIIPSLVEVKQNITDVNVEKKSNIMQYPVLVK